MIKVLKILLILPVCPFSLASLAEEPTVNKKIGGFEVRVLKRKDEHKHTAALLCALIENNSSEIIIKNAWESQLKKPISSDDEYLVRFIMRDMCPKALKSYIKNY